MSINRYDFDSEIRLLRFSWDFFTLHNQTFLNWGQILKKRAYIMLKIVHISTSDQENSFVATEIAEKIFNMNYWKSIKSASPNNKQTINWSLICTSVTKWKFQNTVTMFHVFSYFKYIMQGKCWKFASRAFTLAIFKNFFKFF